jgi:hypothetical protein
MGELRTVGWVLVASRQPPAHQPAIDPALDERTCAASSKIPKPRWSVRRGGDRDEMRY